ncbi:UNKNOWN [Stylonychia lemnae]|uniref:Transmembrane protein n=1 Tax=Stylonychia lemnae TaxID=5949 RepID=A0A078A1A8_STYLE|nr:UNKNOWN [Stylonychia lemnae]|eukprot:CDW75632.1 UNKNOWN [Stylonychia lemnae]
MLKIIQSLDRNGAPVSFNYKGKYQHQTTLGGILTIIQISSLLAFFFILLKKVIDRDMIIRNKSKYMSALNQEQKYHIDLDNFDIAFGIKFVQNSDRYHYQNESINKYLNISFQYYNVSYTKSDDDGQLLTNRSAITIPYEKCQNNRFLGKTEEMEKMGLNKDGWYCISQLDTNVIGQEMSLIRKIVRVTVSPCQNSTINDNSQTMGENAQESNITKFWNISSSNYQICASAQEITDYIHKVQFMIAYINKYFDQDDFEEPVKSEIVVQFYNAEAGFAFNSILNIQKNYLITHDHWLSDIFSSNLYEYLSVQQTKTVFGSIKPGVWEMFNVLIYCKDQEFYIERQVTTVIQIMTLVGGFMNVIFLIIKLTSKIYSKQVFYWDLINKIFHFENPEKCLRPIGSYRFIQSPDKDQCDKRDLKDKVFSRIQKKQYNGV